MYKVWVGAPAAHAPIYGQTESGHLRQNSMRRQPLEGCWDRVRPEDECMVPDHAGTSEVERCRKTLCVLYTALFATNAESNKIKSTTV